MPVSHEADMPFNLFSILASQSDVEALVARYKAGRAGSFHAREKLWDEFIRNFGDARTRYKELETDMSEDECEKIPAVGRFRVREEFRVTMSSIRNLNPDLKCMPADMRECRESVE